MAGARNVLLDTGPLVAALDARDQWHVRCAQAWPELIDRCLTSEAVVTEACHLVLRGAGPAHAPLDFLLRAGIPILPLDAGAHRRAASLMAHYAELPMDYADASLVTIAEALTISTVFTTDRRGFAAYRRASGDGFAMVPQMGAQ